MIGLSPAEIIRLLVDELPAETARYFLEELQSSVATAELADLAAAVHGVLYPEVETTSVAQSDLFAAYRVLRQEVQRRAKRAPTHEGARDAMAAFDRLVHEL